MTTLLRRYLSATGSSPINPAFGALWDDTGAALRRPLNDSPGGSTNTNNFGAETSTSVRDVLVWQHVSPAFGTARTYAGTFTIAVQTAQCLVG